MSSTNLYQPTAEEEANGIFIFQQLFGTLPGIDGSIKVSTKTAIKALERSGVDRILLGTILKVVVDPENSRELIKMHQFHVALRLITLWQDGLLKQEINRAFKEERNQTTPVAVFQKTLWMSSGLNDFPPPSFQGISMLSEECIQNLSKRLKGGDTGTTTQLSLAPSPNQVLSTGAPAPAPAPMEAQSTPKLPKRAPTRQRSVSPDEKPPIDEITVQRRNSSQSATGLQSAIQQMERLGVDTNTRNIQDLKHLDTDNFELLQEQVALQMVLLESKPESDNTKAEQKPAPFRFKSKDLSEDQALQRAIYESTHEASSPPRIVAVPFVAAAPKDQGHSNWLRMNSLSTSFNDRHSETLGDKNKKKKGTKFNLTYAAYLASLDPSNGSSGAAASMKVNTGRDETSQSSDESDRKPAARKPAALKTAPDNQKAKLPKVEKPLQSKAIKTRVRRSKNYKDNRIDEYPQAVQELVMNGFALEKAIQGHSMLGDNFDDIVLFLTSNMTVKELVINGFNLHKVVEAYDLIGDNVDGLLTYLMTTRSS